MLFSELLLIWSLSNYLIGKDQVPEISALGTLTLIHLREHRGWVATVTLKGIICATVAGTMCKWDSWLLPIFILFATVGLPLLRGKISPLYIAEMEISANMAFAVVLAGLIGHSGLKLRWVLFAVDLSPAQITVSSLIAAILLFSLRGGTYIVRSILDKTGALPPLKQDLVPTPPNGGGSPSSSTPLLAKPSPASSTQNSTNDSHTTSNLSDRAKTVDLTEYSRGRMIGNLERLLLVVIVVAGSYQALAFLAAAKGLIRSKNLEDRDWAEYFLVGSLASVLVSMAVGLVIAQLLKYW